MSVTGSYAMLLMFLFLAATAAGGSSLEQKQGNKLNIESVQASTIYARGSFGEGWSLKDDKCQQCNQSDTSAARVGSSASFSIKVSEGGFVRLKSSKPWPSDSILDLWLAGSGITSISISFLDTASSKQSEGVRFTSGQRAEGVIILDQDDDGFTNMQINPAALGILGAPSIAGALTQFDMIEFKDSSNMGFRIVLDDAKLLPHPPAGATPAPAPAQPEQQRPRLVPLLADDLDEFKSGSNRYILKLLPTTTLDQVNSICDELAGKEAQARFKGQCHPPYDNLVKFAGATAGNARLPPEFLTVSVNSKADIQAMRKALTSTAQYMEADLTAFTTARTLKDTASTEQRLPRLEIPGALKTVPGMPSLRLNTTGPITQPTVTILKPVPIKDDVIVKLTDIVHADPIPQLSAAQPAYRPVAVLTPTLIKNDHVVKVDEVVEGSEYAAKTPEPRVKVLTPTVLGSSLNITLKPQSLDPEEASAATLFPIRLGSHTDHTLHVDSMIQDAEFHAAVEEPAIAVLTPVQLPQGGLANLDQIAAEAKHTKIPLQHQGPKEEQLTPARMGKDEDKTTHSNDKVAGPAGTGEFDGRGVHIYVLDSGVRASHLDFKGRVSEGAAIADDAGSFSSDQNGHGTKVAGVVLGGMYGVARSAVLHPVKIMGADGRAAYSSIISGIQWVKDHKANNNIQSAVLVLAVAGPWSVSLNDAVNAASEAGITVVTSAGNKNGGDSCAMSPGSASTAMTVGASSNKDTVASFSNTGDCVTLFAPGESIPSASGNSDYGEVVVNGTSMAAAHVAGAAALYLEHHPQASPAEVKAALLNSAVVKIKPGTDGRPLLPLLDVASSALRTAAPTAPTV